MFLFIYLFIYFIIIIFLWLSFFLKFLLPHHSVIVDRLTSWIKFISESLHKIHQQESLNKIHRQEWLHNIKSAVFNFKLKIETYCNYLHRDLLLRQGVDGPLRFEKSSDVYPSKLGYTFCNFNVRTFPMVCVKFKPNFGLKNYFFYFA